MIKVSKLADYSVVVLSVIGQDKEPLMNAGDVSRASHLPEPTVAKVLKLLAKAGLLTSTRGAGGGYHLSRPVAQISIAEIICAIDGPIALTSCVEQSEGCCDYAQTCPMNGRWNQVNTAIKTALSGVTLADMGLGKEVSTSL